ncbi:MAG TPA: hypothetical protein VFB28_02440 [Terriglobales bacterium]|nr:hypothetical protein [Terriglobales bacterium]
MLLFSCDSCQRIKNPDEKWMVGLAADTVGLTSATREVTILDAWSNARAIDPLAVHFCSVACKDQYVDSLFVEQTAPRKASTKSKATKKRGSARSHSRRTRKAA